MQPEYLDVGYPLFDGAEKERLTRIETERREEMEERKKIAIEDSARINLHNGKKYSKKHEAERELLERLRKKTIEDNLR